jgi:hypothetical protein
MKIETTVNGCFTNITISDTLEKLQVTDFRPVGGKMTVAYNREVLADINGRRAVFAVHREVYDLEDNPVIVLRNKRILDFIDCEFMALHKSTEAKAAGMMPYTATL